VYIGGGGGGGGGDYNCEQWLSLMCKTAYPMGMLMEMVSPLAVLYSNIVYCTNGYHRFVLYSTLGHVGGGNNCGGYTLMGVATTHAG